MAVLHKEFIEYNNRIRLTRTKSDSLDKTKKDLRKKIKKWFKENKPGELKPKFHSQGSTEMKTSVNPITEYDENSEPLYKYDLDDGIYFIEKEGEDNKRSIATWHDWVYQAVENHTTKKTIKKNTCVRVVFADGHNIDLPIYYKEGKEITLAHKAEGWKKSDPKEFYEWFNDRKTKQLERIVRYFKAWRNHKQLNNGAAKLPSGFELTILATNNYREDDLDDVAFRETVRQMNDELNKPFGFKCLRPTTPEDEDVFEDYSETRKDHFLTTLSCLLNDLDKADKEPNFKKASEILRDKQLGDRFPFGEDRDQEDKSNQLSKSIGGAAINPKPYGY